MDQECTEGAPKVPSPDRRAWSQPGLLPPSEVHLQVEVSLDGPAGFGTVSVIVHNDHGEELAALECSPVVPFDQCAALACRMLSEQIAAALAVLSPF